MGQYLFFSNDNKHFHLFRQFLERKIHQKAFLVLLMVFLLAASSCGGDDKKENKEPQRQASKYLLLVIDTSSSMSLPKDIFPEVKNAIEKFIQPLRPNDIVQIITFAKKANVYPPIKIKSDDSKEPILSILRGFKADGQATYTSLALKYLVDMSADIRAQYPNHYFSAVVLSDGKDNPPGGKRRIDLKKYTEKNPQNNIQDWFVHYIALGTVDKRLAKELTQVAPKTKYHKVDIAKKKENKKDTAKDKKNEQKDLEKVITQIDKDVNQGIQKEEDKKRTCFYCLLTHPVAFVLYILIALIILGILYWRKKNLILEGYLAYWKTEDYKPETHVFSLSELHTNKILIGRRGKNAELEINDFSSREPIYIFAASADGNIVPKIKWKAKTKRNFKYHVARTEKHLSDGDIFSAGNYTFKYSK